MGRAAAGTRPGRWTAGDGAGAGIFSMTAVTSVPDGELWASFPEATRNNILGLLGMLLERWAVSAGLAAEGSGGEHGAPR